jgi:hypothetical protein
VPFDDENLTYLCTRGCRLLVDVLTDMNGFTGLFTPKKCFKKCMKRCYKKHPLHPEEEAEETLVERSEDAVLTIAEVQDDGPCGGWAQTKCSIKESLSWDVDGVYEKCMQRCLDEYNGAALSKRSDETDTVQVAAANLATAEAQGIIEIDPCGWTAQTWCTTKASLAFWKDFDHVYVKCMAECGPTQLTKRSGTVDNTVQLEATTLATTEAQGIFDIDPCGYTAQAWCTYKAYATWWFSGGFEHVYEKCTAKCAPSQITKRSETIDTVSATTLKSSNMVDGDGDLTEKDEHSGIYPQEGRLGGLRGVNDADNHVCNDTLQYARCSFLASLQFWHPKTAFRRCLAECVRKHDGDNWTAEDVECDE